VSDTPKLNWVKDTPKVRSFNGKKLMMEGRGIFLMQVLDVGPGGETNPGFVLVRIEPSPGETIDMPHEYQ
jgi:hypothetical protein